MAAVVTNLLDISTNQTDAYPPVKNNILHRRWVLWSHLPQNPDWKIHSYKQIATITC